MCCVCIASSCRYNAREQWTVSPLRHLTSLDQNTALEALTEMLARLSSCIWTKTCCDIRKIHRTQGNSYPSWNTNVLLSSCILRNMQSIHPSQDLQMHHQILERMLSDLTGKWICICVGVSAERFNAARRRELILQPNRWHWTFKESDSLILH